ncbi:Fur family transcriptional regulator [Streptomyces sp. NPDC048282]|uniref:Fur family transcriptional regulator n=1 Tax=Streptomyces sp. NPDC048282 TaxID=3365528 RepID=UPI00371173A7
MRCTPGRLRILALLADSARHLSPAETCAELARSGEAVHATTVYRTLETLVEVGLVHAVRGSGAAVRYGATGEPHHHTACRECGSVGALDGRHLAESMGAIEELTGLRPDPSGALLIYGRCAECAA